MIIKMGMPLLGAQSYERFDRLVKAIKMNVPFELETPGGWYKGSRGEWVVEIDTNIRFPVRDEWFKQAYTPCKHNADGK